MKEDNLIQFKKPEANTTSDLLTEIARQGAREMLSVALGLEVQNFLELHQQTLPNGEPRLIRNGYLPERAVQTGIGAIEGERYTKYRLQYLSCFAKIFFIDIPGQKFFIIFCRTAVRNAL